MVKKLFMLMAVAIFAFPLITTASALNLIQPGSACIGLDCVEAESFDFDTLRLKENNIRLEFQDTSNTQDYPGADWRITINDTINGGDDYFAIDSVDNGETPFRIDYGAPDNAIYVDDDGNVGINTQSPRNGIGYAKLALHGDSTSVGPNGPHIQTTTSEDDYPVLTLFSGEHDNMAIMLDSYYEDVPGYPWRSSDSGSNFQLRKYNDTLFIRYASGHAQGDAISFIEGISLQIDGDVGLGTLTPRGPFHIVADDNGYLFWDSPVVTSTKQTILEAGVLGDFVQVEFIMVASSGNNNDTLKIASSGGSSSRAVGSNTIQIKWETNGSLTTWRSAGAEDVRVQYIVRYLN